MSPALSRILVVDNGAYSIKAGYAAENATTGDCQVIPNCIARSRDKKVFVGGELETCKDFGMMSFRRPVERVCLAPETRQKDVIDTLVALSDDSRY